MTKLTINNLETDKLTVNGTVLSAIVTEQQIDSKISLSCANTLQEAKDYTDENAYTLPIASSTALGGVKINGNNLAIAADGTLSASGGGSSGRFKVMVNPNQTESYVVEYSQDCYTVSDFNLIFNVHFPLGVAGIYRIPDDCGINLNEAAGGEVEAEINYRDWGTGTTDHIIIPPGESTLVKDVTVWILENGNVYFDGL